MKKLLSLILTVFLSFFLLTACGLNQKAQTSPSAGAAYSAEKEDGGITVKKDGTYTDKNHVAAYIHKYKTLPSNYIIKKEARKLGWKEKGTLDRVAPGKSIGGDRFGNYEKLLPEKNGRTWKECTPRPIIKTSNDYIKRGFSWKSNLLSLILKQKKRLIST